VAPFFRTRCIQPVAYMRSLGRGTGTPGCKAGVEISAKQPPQTSPTVAKPIMSSKFAVIRPGHLSQHSLSSGRRLQCSNDSVYINVTTYAWHWYSIVADITILLALSVFQTIVNASLPPTSDAVPLLGTSVLFQTHFGF